MKLSFHLDSKHMFPYGYWYAVTDNGNYDATGPTIEAALAELVNILETVVDDNEGKNLSYETHDPILPTTSE